MRCSKAFTKAATNPKIAANKYPNATRYWAYTSDIPATLNGVTNNVEAAANTANKAAACNHLLAFSDKPNLSAKGTSAENPNATVNPNRNGPNTGSEYNPKAFATPAATNKAIKSKFSLQAIKL